MYDNMLHQEEIVRLEKLWQLFQEVAAAFTRETGEKEQPEGGKMGPEKMGPEEVFGGVTALEWGQQLCLSLIKYKAQIKRQLEREGRYSEFSEAIQQWKDDYVNNDKEDHENTARALYDICWEFCVISYMIREGMIEKEAVVGERGRGAVRTRARLRGVSKSAIRDLREQMGEVARLFGE